MPPFDQIRALLARWLEWRQVRAERRARAAAARSIAAEIERVKAQRDTAERLHRPTRALNKRLYVLMTERLRQELAQ